MLPLRFFVFASLAGICLWGLFSLLENLHEPELLRSPKAVVVKGCNPIETQEAMRLCHQLFCEKALLDSKIVPRSARFEVTIQKTTGAAELIGGVVTSKSEAKRHFACVLDRGIVTSKAILSPTELETLAGAHEWSL